MALLFHDVSLSVKWITVYTTKAARNERNELLWLVSWGSGGADCVQQSWLTLRGDKFLSDHPSFLLSQACTHTQTYAHAHGYKKNIWFLFTCWQDKGLRRRKGVNGSFFLFFFLGQSDIYPSLDLFIYLWVFFLSLFVHPHFPCFISSCLHFQIFPRTTIFPTVPWLPGVTFEAHQPCEKHSAFAHRLNYWDLHMYCAPPTHPHTLSLCERKASEHREMV